MSILNLDKSDETSVTLELRVSGDDARQYVIADGSQFDSLAELVATHPELGAPEQVALYCELCLHFFPGPGCLLIEEPDEFRARYQALLRHADENIGDQPSAADFGPYDVSEIAAPQVIKNQFVFYAEGSLYNVPYRVEAPWPAGAQGPVSFLLLPLQE